MDYTDNSVYRDEHLQKIIDDTDEIIRNFREISEIMAEKLEYSDSMINLGHKLADQRKNDSHFNEIFREK